MCGRYSFIADPALFQEQFSCALPQEAATSYNIAPTAIEPVVLGRGDGVRAAEMMRWGLLPAWLADKRPGGFINARAETADSKASFSEAWKRRRCIVPASGYYEWLKAPGGKEPQYFTSPLIGYLRLAGLWDEPVAPGAPATFTILTVEAEEAYRAVHDRMPCILDAAAADLWLSSDEVSAAALLGMRRPSGLTYRPVSKLVNSPANDGPELID